MLKFTLRRNVSASIVSDTRWSPFEIIRLVVSITLNSIKRNGSDINNKFKAETNINDHKICKSKNINKPLEENKKYTLSFNCMRNGAKIPIGYSLGCVYSLYDLAEKKLEAYYSNIDSYSEIVRIKGVCPANKGP